MPTEEAFEEAEKGKFMIGGYLGCTYFVKLNNGTLQYGESLGNSKYGEIKLILPQVKGV